MVMLVSVNNMFPILAVNSEQSTVQLQLVPEASSRHRRQRPQTPSDLASHRQTARTRAMKVRGLHAPRSDEQQLFGHEAPDLLTGAHDHPEIRI
jgi:hypothetical protein